MNNPNQPSNTDPKPSADAVAKSARRLKKSRRRDIARDLLKPRRSSADVAGQVEDEAGVIAVGLGLGVEDEGISIMDRDVAGVARLVGSALSRRREVVHARLSMFPLRGAVEMSRLMRMIMM